MARWLTVLATLAIVGVALVAYTNNFFQPASLVTLPSEPQAAAQPGVLNAQERPVAAPGVVPAAPHSLAAGLHSYLPIPECQLVAIDKQDVPCGRDGKLLYVATELDPSQPLPPKEELVKVWEVYAYVEIGKDENVPEDQIVERVIEDGREKRNVRFRRLRANEHIEAENVDRVIIARKERVLRKLQEGAEVVEGQLLAMVDPAVAAAEMVNKLAKIVAARAETDAAGKARGEAFARYQTLERLNAGTVKNVVAIEELRGAEFAWWKYRYEEDTKRATIGSTRAETDQVLTTLMQHEVRAATSGVVKNIARLRGEAVKNLETLMQIVNHDRLRVRGEVGMQHLPFLKLDDEVVIEPTVPVRPRMVLSGHLYEIKCIAVSQKRQIVSGSEDRTARVWDLESGMSHALNHPAEVRAVACTPIKAAQNLCVTGCADGLGRLWDLNDLNAAPRPLAERQRGPITAVAFSPDGKWCVTGGGPQDRMVRLWDSTNGSLLQTFEGHRGEVTSLQFLSPTELISCCSDKSLIAWKLNPNGSVADKLVYEHRSGDVPVLGVNPDPANRQVLIDYGRELRIFSAETKQIEGVLQNSSGVGNFSTMALFSPNGKMILTHSAAENRLQLWRAPTKDWRGYEVRQLVWQGDQTTCGAFAPSLTGKETEDFVVTGTKDHKVVVWSLPSEEEISVLLKAKIKLIDQDLESNARQVRIWADLDNPRLENGRRRLMPGQSATMVAYPK